VTVVEVEEIVPVGSLDPDHIHTPGVYVDRLIQTVSEKRIEQRTVRQKEPGSSSEAVAQRENV
jgi:3-oxoacid CoA-transferase subunit A